MPGLPAKKTMGAAANLLTTVERALVFDPVQVIAHHRRVVRPAFLRRTDFVVAIQKTDPITGWVPTRYADQLRAEPRNDETQASIFVGQNIEQPIAPLLFALRKHDYGNKPRACF